MQDIQPALPDRSKRWSLVASASSIVSAFIASICCVGPLVFALLGIGGAGLLVTLSPYQPYFIALTIVLLAAGFYLTYWKSKTARAASGAACACPAPAANRAGKLMLWIATVLAAVFIAFPFLAPYLFD